MVFGLLGPNGAGKTTLVRILATLLEPDPGRAELLGHDVVAESSGVRELLALTGQFAAVDELPTDELAANRAALLGGFGWWTLQG
jgi:ABC-2 type transport system ATP-binding protein